MNSFAVTADNGLTWDNTLDWLESPYSNGIVGASNDNWIAFLKKNDGYMTVLTTTDTITWNEQTLNSSFTNNEMIAMLTNDNVNIAYGILGLLLSSDTEHWYESIPLLPDVTQKGGFQSVVVLS
jgi:hypothetical protein